MMIVICVDLNHTNSEVADQCPPCFLSLPAYLRLINCIFQAPDEIETDTDLEDEQEMYDSRSRCEYRRISLHS